LIATAAFGVGTPAGLIAVIAAVCWKIVCASLVPKKRVPEVFTATFAYYRLRKSDYSEKELEQVEARLRAAAQEREVYAFLKHEDTPEGAINARRLLQGLTS